MRIILCDYKLNNLIFCFIFLRGPPFGLSCIIDTLQTTTFQEAFAMQKYLEDYRQMIAFRGLTQNTIKSYSTYIRAYLDYLQTVLHKNPEDVSWQELRNYIIFLQQERSLSNRTINHCISQLRFFTLYILRKPWDPYQLPFRKFNTYIPFVPSKKEVLSFISSLPDIKDQAMVSLLYSAGLRIGEVRNLRCSDIDRTNMRIYISHGKNRSDRYAILSPNALLLLERYWRARRPSNYLFPQQSGIDKPIHHNYLLIRIFEHEERLGLPHRISCHTFRHAFGTHLYQEGVDLLTIKSLLGHKSLNSTTIYVHLGSNGIGKALSPFDTLPDSPHV